MGSLGTQEVAYGVRDLAYVLAVGGGRYVSIIAGRVTTGTLEAGLRFA